MRYLDCDKTIKDRYTKSQIQKEEYNMAVLALTSETFEKEISSGITLVDFWAAWCGPCKMFAPVLDEIAEANLPDVKVCKVNVDEQPELASRFRVMTIPTVVIFKDGEAKTTSVGVKPKKEVLEMIERVR